MRRKQLMAILFAILAALFYAINMPFSKYLLQYVPETIMAGLLYMGAGLGVGLMFTADLKKNGHMLLLDRKDLPYTIGMIVLDIMAPISLMYGLNHTTSANASLLNNFEIVATSIIALIIFKEAISKRLWLAICFVTLSSVILTADGLSGFQFSKGSLFVLLAAVFWGLENNCTRKISEKNVYEIVTLKGICSGLGSLMIGYFLGERLPQVKLIVVVLLLGYVAYGLSIFFYIKAQKDLGAAKTSAYYAIAPFAGAFLSFVLLKEGFTAQFLIALILMMIGSVIATADTMIVKHAHIHTHTITHTHDGSTHTHVVTHSHSHTHVMSEKQHMHMHLAHK